MKPMSDRRWRPPAERGEPYGTARRFFGGLFLLLLGGCAHVKPWQHDLMAQPAMQVDAAPLQSALDEHIYFSKEAASGGRGFGGGGCGCN